ncbi:methyltransferase [Lithospermum erythrorhizon]|uniref:Methyltransferase n=1 Tax=Lithospermum erythrorhizon TaxID=34254 RepID=A0AAV3P319_LITER
MTLPFVEWKRKENFLLCVWCKFRNGREKLFSYGRGSISLPFPYNFNFQPYTTLIPIHSFPSTLISMAFFRLAKSFLSEDMVKDGYEDIMNTDISSVVIEMMKLKNEQIPQLKYMQMDVRDMSFFPDESFDSIIDKGTLDSLMCGTNAPICAAQMLGEVSRLLKPGGVYILITYGDPKVRIPHLKRYVYSWKIELYIIPRPGFLKPDSSTTSTKSYLEPVPTTEEGLLHADYTLEDPDSHFIYVCSKVNKPIELDNKSSII